MEEDIYTASRRFKKKHIESSHLDLIDIGEREVLQLLSGAVGEHATIKHVDNWGEVIIEGRVVVMSVEKYKALMRQLQEYTYWEGWKCSSEKEK